MNVPPLCPAPLVAAAFASVRARSPVPILLAVALSLGVASPGITQASAPSKTSSPTSTSAAHPYAAHVAEAARRFGIPEAWIWSVMRVESAGDPSATSRAGAMGLMQVMPNTYAELRSRYGLGPSPYDLRDNILAGAAYLREMHDRYGPTGMLAAYNAGPGRWEDHVARGRPLPAETVAYMARLGAAVGGSAAPSQAVVPHVDRFAWRRATLFAQLVDDSSTDQMAASVTQDDGGPGATLDVAVEAQTNGRPAPEQPSHALFAITRPR